MKDNSYDTQLFMKCLKSKCTNLKNDIESLLSEVSNWISNSGNQVIKSESNISISGKWIENFDRNQTVFTSSIEKVDSNLKEIPKNNETEKKSIILSQINSNQKNKINQISENISCKKEIDNIENPQIDERFKGNFSYNKKDDLIQNNHILENKQKLSDFLPKISKNLNLNLNVREKDYNEIDKQSKKSNNTTSLIDHLKSLKDFDFDPLEMKNVKKDRSVEWNQIGGRRFQRFCKKQNGKIFQKNFEFKKSNLETNLFILNNIYQKQIVELNLDIDEQNKFLNEINNKYNFKSEN